MSKIDLKSFSTSELRSAGVLRATCSEATVCRHHGYAPPCELCEVEGDATVICTVCGATLTGGVAVGVSRACQAEKALESGKGPRARLSLTPAMESSLAQLLRRRQEEKEAREAAERKAREAEAAAKLEAAKKAEAERLARARRAELARRGVMPGFYVGLAVVAVLVVHHLFGVTGTVMAAVVAVPAGLLGLAEGIGAAIGAAFVGGLAGFLAGAAAYFIATPFGRPSPVVMTLLSAVILSFASITGGLISQLGRVPRVAAIVTIAAAVAALAWFMRPQPQWTAENGTKMVRVHVDRVGRTGLHYYDDEWREFWSDYTSGQPLIYVIGCNDVGSRRTCQLGTPNGLTGTLEFSTTDAAGTLTVSNGQKTATTALVPTAHARKLQVLMP